jgi:hypothetical protein
MSSWFKAAGFPNQMLWCYPQIVCGVFYFLVFLKRKKIILNESTMFSLLLFQILNQWNFHKNWYEHYIIIHGQAMFQKVVLEKCS